MKIAAVAALSMLVAVACGAFGAHALRDHILPSDMVIWEKAVLYHLVHGLAALVVSTMTESILPVSQRKTIATFFLVSLTIFSGSLYVLVLASMRWLGMVTPLGGVGFMLGWGMLALALWRSRGSNPG